MLEFASDPVQVIRSLYSVLVPGGSMVVLVPQGPSLFGSVDQTLGHRRRFSRSEMRALVEAEGFETAELSELNRVGKPAWWLYGKALGRSKINKVTLKLFDKTVWLWRRIDAIFPWSGLSLIVVAHKPAAAELPQSSPVHADAIGRG